MGRFKAADVSGQAAIAGGCWEVWRTTAAEIVGTVQGGTSSAPGGRGCQGDSCKERQGRCECRGQAGRRCEILEEEGSHEKRSKKTKIEFGAKFEAESV